ncbi:HlyD family efflux transporter periplasmic adaptor subunit [Solirubrobacter phytolaccae]|uniref:HlyD family efflux transporter periplasmic adaptor subunit n=1 Tax=Solirubrobacter phytolaccae TaxID=1404360 RepID=A0A9X3NAX9_9ACTN|nr:efflux RND transporter periplasmic adaptor subunit [Solirubrobacter phytolaccae]MDA0183265.1 HlyD family efflux transporter periplasmic adaptor subunit [Solirubrobacter phytolaccae]
MRRALCGLAVLAVAGCGAEPVTTAAAPANTLPVERGALADMVSLNGILTYGAGPDGAPYSAVNYARGIYTKLPKPGDEVGCGDVLYRVDDDPVRLTCRTHAYRSLAKGKAVFLPRAGRIAKVSGQLGGVAQPGAEVVQATSATLEVQVELEPSQQADVKPGDAARITLPGNRSVTGKVARLGKVARTAEEDQAPAAATIPASIRLDAPKQARGLEKAPVQVEITTKGVEDALSVPVTALVGKAGGGFAVEVVRAGDRRELVGVELGLFDTTGGRVEVAGALQAGDQVVVPSP